LPKLTHLETDLKASIEKNRPAMVQTSTSYDAKIEAAKKKKTEDADAEDDDTNGEG
jgi:hypothetical protein